MNDNETVAEIVQNMRRKADQADFVCCGNIDASHVRYYANSILAAHRREMAAKDDERLTVVANYETIIAAKDDEIARLNEQVIVHDCWADTARMCAENDLSMIAKELAEEVAARDAEIEKLRALVKELADEMENIMSIFCHGNCEGCPLKDDCDAFRCRALVAKAREAVK